MDAAATVPVDRTMFVHAFLVGTAVRQIVRTVRVQVDQLGPTKLTRQIKHTYQHYAVMQAYAIIQRENVTASQGLQGAPANAVFVLMTVLVTDHVCLLLMLAIFMELITSGATSL